MGGALYGAVGSGEEECHILAVDGEGDEAEVVGVEAASSSMNLRSRAPRAGSAAASEPAVAAPRLAGSPRSPGAMAR